MDQTGRNGSFGSLDYGHGDYAQGQFPLDYAS